MEVGGGAGSRAQPGDVLGGAGAGRLAGVCRGGGSGQTWGNAPQAVLRPSRAHAVPLRPACSAPRGGCEGGLWRKPAQAAGQWVGFRSQLAPGCMVPEARRSGFSFELEGPPEPPGSFSLALGGC